MTNNGSKTKRRAGKGFIITGVLILAFAFYVDLQVRPLIERAGEFQCRVAAVRIINDAVYRELTGGQYDYENIVRLTYDSDGEVKSVTGDTQTINRLKSRATLLINEAVSELGKMDIGISLGTASGISFFYGRGPQIPVRVLPKGAANAVLISEFTPAGINQTLHRIILEVGVDVTAIIPGFNKTLSIETNFIVAETVIVGKVPNMYAEITTAGGELFSRGEFIA